ncbi:hypothetical protein KJ966_29990 [bacterium]|nr:hypothetical protein [bacterium]
MRKWLKISIGLALSIFLILLFSSTFFVEYRVQKACKTATSIYPGDKIQALINTAKSQVGCDEEKSRALWALGQLGAKQALPYLLESYNGIKETDICVYEAQFAIEKIQKDQFNLPGFLWRSLLEKLNQSITDT